MGTLVVGGLQSLGLKTISTPGGSATVLEITVTSAFMTGLDLLMPCVNRSRMHITASQSRAPGSLTLDITGLQAQVGPIVITISLDSPASIALLPLGDITFLSAKLLVLSITASQMALSGASITPVNC